MFLATEPWLRVGTSLAGVFSYFAVERKLFRVVFLPDLELWVSVQQEPKLLCSFPEPFGHEDTKRAWSLCGCAGFAETEFLAADRVG